MDQKSHEQRIVVTTIIKLDKWDILKCFFGRVIRVTTTIYVPQEQKIPRVNTSACTDIVPMTKYFNKVDKPGYGYEAKM